MRYKALLLTVVLGSFLLSPTWTEAIPSGVLDQTLTGNLDCNGNNFRGSISSGGWLGQEFVPSKSLLRSVDLCLTAMSGRQITLNIREGTVASPGAILATGTATATVSDIQWVRVNLSAPLATTPGVKFVLDIPESATFAWMGTCGGDGTTCSPVDPDLYPAGESNSGEYIGDFAFRTYASPQPGDGNGDGQVSMVDAMLTAQCVAGLIDCGTIDETAADVNCSGSVSMVDAMLVAQKVAGLIDEFSCVP